MNSFLFQKEQINCNCFDNSPKTGRRIFRSQSYHTSNNSIKQSKQIPIRNQSEQGKHKKKSLKKQKQFSSAGSQKDNKQKQQIQNNVLIPQLPINSNSHPYKKQQKVINFDNFQGNKQMINAKYDKTKPSHTLRVNKTQDLLINDFLLSNPVSNNQIVSQNHLKINPTFQPPSFYTYQNITYQQKHNNPQDYEQLINRQFEKDLYQFKIQMQKKSKPLQKQKIQINKRTSIQLQKKDQTIYKIQRQKKYQKNSIERKEKQRNQCKINSKSRKQSTSANKIANQKYEIDDAVNRMSAIQLQHTPVRHASFRGSVVSQKQKQSISKKMKGRMLPKEIQSQRDGSSSSSDKLSQVLGRGWDGLTQQKIQLQQLEQMAKRQKLNSQTMVTQQSHIKNSQIKTFTDYSNSFISPKSQYSKAFPFGGGHKYGITGMSYHHIQELGKPKHNYHQKRNF